MRSTILIHEWVTGGGLAGSHLPKTWADEGAAMRRVIARDFAAIQPDPPRILMTLDSRFPDESGPWETIRITEGEERERVRALARESDYSLIIAPETGGILAGWASELKSIGANSLGCDEEAVRLAGDKLRMAELFHSMGLPVPPTRRASWENGWGADLSFPLVLKPIGGAGGVDTFLIRKPDEQPVPRERLGEFIIQPCLAGDALSATFLVDRSGRAWPITVGRQFIEIVEGAFRYKGGELPISFPIHDALFQRVLQAVPGLRGIVGIDFIHDRATDSVTIVEINPRPTTSCVGVCSILQPGRLARAWLEACEKLAPHDSESLSGLSLAVQSREESPVAFLADGTLSMETRETRDDNRRSSGD